MKANLSVIIPTYNRRDILSKTLEAYKRQTAADEILELVVVDDGSTDRTGETVAEAAISSPFPIRRLRQDNRGLASARNLGIRGAMGELVLFGDDDIIPTPTLVAEHAAWHRKYPAPSVAVLGSVAWSPEVNPTPFMEWLGLDGPLFCFGRLSPGGEVGSSDCYFCNTSAKKSFLLTQGMFDEDFRGYGYEDIELGCRLMKKGFRLLYNPAAAGLHYKRMSFADVCDREEMSYASRQLFEAKVPVMPVREQPASRRPWINRLRLGRLVRFLAPVLAQFAFVLDTRIPLPWPLYRSFYDNVMPWIMAKRRATNKDLTTEVTEATEKTRKTKLET